MYRDIVQWTRVRKHILDAGNSIRAVCKAEGICAATVHKMLLHAHPRGYQEKKPRQARGFGDQITTLNALLSKNDVRPVSTRHSGEEIFQILCKEGYKGSAAAVRYQMRRHKDADEAHLWGLLYHIVRTQTKSDATDFLASLFPRGTLVNQTTAARRRRLAIHQRQCALYAAAATPMGKLAFKA